MIISNNYLVHVIFFFRMDSPLFVFILPSPACLDTEVSVSILFTKSMCNLSHHEKQDLINPKTNYIAQIYDKNHTFS